MQKMSREGLWPVWYSRSDYMIIIVPSGLKICKCIYNLAVVSLYSP